jgi:Domain of Unknown Function with PDB structure (DUF3857)
MKKILLLQFFIFTATTVFSQDFPDFGIPSKEDIALQECPFEKEAAAVVLLDEAFSYSEDDQKLITTYHIKIKILKQSGLSRANITIPFLRYEHFEYITDLKALTLNMEPDGTMISQSVNKKSFYTVKVNDFIGEISFAFPSVKAGSIIEYQYRSVMQNYWGLRDWYFQQDIPVITSRYHLKTVFSKNFSYKVFKSTGMEFTETLENNRVFFEMRNIPSLTSEPFMDAKKDYLQRVNFSVGNYNSRWGSGQLSSYKSSWQKLNDEILGNRNFGPQLFLPVKGAAGFVDSVKLLSTHEEKMAAVFNYVKNRMSWNKVNDFYSDDVNKVWERKSGSSGDINMLLINLLLKAKIEAYPLLVSKRFNGSVDTSYPNAEQFNALQVCADVNNRKYIIDATEKFNTCTIFPESVLNTTAFMLNAFSGQLLTIISDTVTYKQVVELDITAATDSIAGAATIYNFDYAKLAKRNKYALDTAKMKDQLALPDNLLVNISNYSIQDAEKETVPFKEKFEFSAGLADRGDYLFIPLHLFTAFNKNPFVTDNRFSNINFGYNRTFIVKGKIKVSDQYIIDGMPENKQFEVADLNVYYTRKLSSVNASNTIEFEIKIEFLKSLYEVSEYPSLKNAYKTIFSRLAEQIILKRK